MALKPAQDAWTSAKAYVKDLVGANGTTVELQALNSANRFFHLAHPWSWTLGALSAVNLVNGTQDYTIATPPTDFLRPHQVKNYTGAESCTDLEIVGYLPASVTVLGNPTKVSVFDPGSGAYKYRLWAVPTGMLAGVEHHLVGEYKRTTTTITSGNKATASILSFPDDYYYVYEALVLYYALLYANDVRAGVTQIASNGSRQSSGQLGFCLAAIQDLKTTELPSLNTMGTPK